MNAISTADVNGTTIAYSDTGPHGGTPVLLSHSLFFDHTMFAPLTSLLVEQGYRVVAYDHRGQGASAPGTPDQLGMDALTEDAAALITQLGLGRVHVVGNSMGGFIALRLAARRPDLLLSAAALGSSAEEERQLAEFAPLVERLKQVGGEELVDTLMYIMFGDTSLADPDETVLAWRQQMSTLDPSIGECADAVIHRGSIVEELSGCRVPVLAVAGTEDHAYPPPISDQNIVDATGGRSTTLEAAGHSVALEQPHATAEALLRFFDEVSTP